MRFLIEPYSAVCKPMHNTIFSDHHLQVVEIIVL